MSSAALDIIIQFYGYMYVCTHTHTHTHTYTHSAYSALEKLVLRYADTQTINLDFTGAPLF